MSNKVTVAVNTIRDALDAETGPEDMSKEEYLDVLNELVDEFNMRIEAVQSELDGD